MTTKIEIGSVVVLKGGGPKMTVVGIAVHPNGGDSVARGEGCALCGAYPRIESSEAQVTATMMLAQQQWRTRHDAHVSLDSHTTLQCDWMRDEEHESGTFPLEAVRLATEDDDCHCYRRRRYRRFRVIGEG